MKFSSWVLIFLVCNLTFSRIPAFRLSRSQPTERISDNTDKAPITPQIRAIAERLRRGEIQWSTFTRERISRAYRTSASSSQPAALPGDIVLALPDSSSTSSTPPALKMSRRPSYRRAGKGPAEDSPRVRSGDFSAALNDVLRSSAASERRVEVSEEGTRVQRPNTEVVVASTPRVEQATPIAEQVSSRSTSSLRSGEAAPLAKRARTEIERASRSGSRRPDLRQSSSSGDGSTGSRPFHWRFEHTKDYPVTEDSQGIAHLLRHCKAAGCNLPAVKNITEREAYVEMAAATGKAMEANNRLVALYEQRLRDVPRREELEEMKAVVSELKEALQLSKDREARLKEKVIELPDLKLRLLELECRDDDFSHKLEVAKNQIFALQEESRSALEQASRLSGENRRMVVEQEDLVRRQARMARRELAKRYQDVLKGIKEKWEKKKAEADAEINLQEVVANLDLLEEIIAGETTAEEELPKLGEKKAECEMAFKDAEVSDLSLSKLELPQISEDSVALMEVDPATDVPMGLDQFGSNTGFDEVTADEVARE